MLVKKSKLNAVKKEAQLTIKETKKLLRRAKGKISAQQHDDINKDLSNLQTCLNEKKEYNVIQNALGKLQPQLDQYLDPFRKPSWRESLESVAVAILVALLLRSFVVEAFKIPSGSMIPTLAIGDQIFVNKLLYGVRVPFTAIRLVDFAAPERGEVIVFICPQAPHEDYIKRVVGIPGDKIAVRDGVLFVNDEPVQREFIERKTYWDRDANTGTWSPFDAFLYQERVNDNQYTVIFDADPMQSAPDYGPIVISEDQVFVMGDNRDHSYDSRFWGTVPMSNILGRSLFVWFSLGKDGLAWKRLGHWIE